MYDLTRSCFLCLNQDSNNLRSVFDNDHINAPINFILKFVLPEIELFHPEHPALVCNTCLVSLTSYHQFKSNCIKINQYIKTNLLRLRKPYNGHVSQNNQPTYNRPQLNDHRNVQTSRSAVLQTQNVPHRTQLNCERDRQIIEARNNFVTQNTNVSNTNRPTQNIPDRAQLNDARNIKLTDPRNNFRTQNTNVASEPTSYNRVHPNIETINSRTQISTEGSNNFRTQNTIITNNENRQTQNIPPSYNRVQPNVETNNSRTQISSEASNHFRTQNTNNENRQTPTVPPPYYRVHPNAQNTNLRTQVSTERSNGFRTQNTTVTNANGQTPNQPPLYNRVHPSGEFNNSNLANDTTQNNTIHTKTSAPNNNSFNRPSSEYVNTSNNKTQITTQHERNNTTTQISNLTSEILKHALTQTKGVQVNASKNNINYQERRNNLSTENTNLLIENRRRNSNTQENSIQQVHATWGQNPAVPVPYNGFQNIVPQNPTPYSKDRTLHGLQEKLNARLRIQTAPRNSFGPQNTQYNNTINSEEVNQSFDRRIYQNNSTISNNEVQMNANYNSQLMRAPPPYSYAHSITQSRIETVSNVNYTPQTRINSVSNSQEINTLTNNEQYMTCNAPYGLQRVLPETNEQTNRNSTIQEHPNNVIQTNPNNTPVYEQQNGGKQVQIQAERNNIRRPSFDLSQNAKRQKILHNTEDNNSANKDFISNSGIQNNDDVLNSINNLNNTANAKVQSNDYSSKEPSQDTTRATTNIVTHKPQTTNSNPINVNGQPLQSTVQPSTDTRTNNLHSVKENRQPSEITSTEITDTTTNYNLRRKTRVSYTDFFENEETNTNKQTNNQESEILSSTITSNHNNTPMLDTIQIANTETYNPEPRIFDSTNKNKQTQNIASFDNEETNTEKQTNTDALASKTAPQIDSDKDQQNDTVQTLLFSNDLESNIKSEPTPIVKYETSNEPKNIELLFENLSEEEKQNIKTEAEKKITAKTYHPETSPYDHHYKFVEIMYRNQCIKNYVLNKFIDKPKPYLDDQIYTGNTLQVESTLELFLYNKEIPPGVNLRKLLNITSNEPKDTNNQQIQITNTQAKEKQPADIDIRENNRTNIEPTKDSNDQQIKTTIPLESEQPSADIKQNTEYKKDASRQQIKTSNIQPVTEQPSIKENIDIEENFDGSKNDRKCYQELLNTVNKQSTEHKKHTNDQQINTKIEAESEQPLLKDIKNFNQEVLGTENVKQNTESNKQQIQPVTLVKENIDIEENVVPFNDIDRKLYNNILTQTEIKTIKSEPDDFFEEIPPIDNTVPIKNEITRNVPNDDADIKEEMLAYSETDIKFYEDLINESETNSMTNFESNENSADGIIDLTETTDEDGLVKCKVCQIELPQRIMYFHMHIHGGLQCPECKKKFDTKYSLKQHIKYAHDINYKCNICNKTFAFKKFYEIHLKTHGGIEDRPHECQICHKRFIFSSGLKSHMYNHATEENRTEQCPKCDKKFLSTAHLKHHLKAHAREKRTNFDCDVCGQHFTRLPNLSQHQLIHKGVKKWECKICHKKFLHNSHLKQHMPTHGGDKEFKCSKCDKSFTYKCSLEKHMKVHENIKSKRKKKKK